MIIIKRKYEPDRIGISKYWRGEVSHKTLGEYNALIVSGSHLFVFFLFLVFMWHNHIPKLNITLPSEVLVSLDKRPYRNWTFHNVLARQGSSYCDRACLNFQAFALLGGLRPEKAVVEAKSRVIALVFAN